MAHNPIPNYSTFRIDITSASSSDIPSISSSGTITTLPKRLIRNSSRPIIWGYLKYLRPPWCCLEHISPQSFKPHFQQIHRADDPLIAASVAGQCHPTEIWVQSVHKHPTSYCVSTENFPRQSNSLGLANALLGGQGTGRPGDQEWWDNYRRPPPSGAGSEYADEVNTSPTVRKYLAQASGAHADRSD